MKKITMLAALLGLSACNATSVDTTSVQAEAHKQAAANTFMPRKVHPYVVKVASPMTDASASLTPENVKQAANLVADWQIRHMPAFHASPLANFEGLRRYSFGGWLMATMAVGMTEWGKASGDSRYLDFVKTESERFKWQVEERIFDADDYAIGQTYLELYELDSHAADITPLRNRLDYIYSNWPVVKKPAGEDCQKMQRSCRTRWTWIDALFMAAPVWVQMAKVTNDPRYLEFADHEYWAIFDKLWDAQERLIYRDERFPGMTDQDGEKVFWSRGNGWVFGSFARVLTHLPKDHSSRQKYIDRFTAMAARLAEIQQPGGYWTSSLTNPALTPMPENSGSGFYTYGLAWGINQGLLDKETYLPVLQKAWQSLVNSIYADGRLAYVQPAGAAPSSVQKESTDVYGIGSFLLAAAEVHKLAEQMH